MSDQTFGNNKQNKKTTPVNGSKNDQKNVDLARQNEIMSIWLGMRDSNPLSWDQNPLPYRLANPHQ